MGIDTTTAKDRLETQKRQRERDNQATARHYRLPVTRLTSLPPVPSHTKLKVSGILKLVEDINELMESTGDGDE